MQKVKHCQSFYASFFHAAYTIILLHTPNGSLLLQAYDHLKPVIHQILHIDSTYVSAKNPAMNWPITEPAKNPVEIADGSHPKSHTKCH